jgi:hypothetical protein
MGKRRGNFKITNRNKEKYVPKQKYDLSQYKGKRIIGYINKETPIVGSKSELIKPSNIYSLSPFELYEKKINEYRKRETMIFKKYMSDSSISMW